MTALRTRIDELSRVLQGHKADEEEALAVGRLSRFAGDLQKRATRLADLAEAAEELRQGGIPIAPPEKLDELLSGIQEARTSATADGLSAGCGDEPRAVALAAEVARAASASVDGAWNQLKEQQAPPPIDEELLKLASRDDARLSTAYEHAQTQIFLLREKPRPSQGDISTWLHAVGQLQSIADEVAASAPSQKVIDFLREAGSPAGAPIEYLQLSEVREWLSEERAARYRVVTRQGHR